MRKQFGIHLFLALAVVSSGCSAGKASQDSVGIGGVLGATEAPGSSLPESGEEEGTISIGAQEIFGLTALSVGGTGCAQGTVQTEFDGSTARILTDGMIASAGSLSGHTVDRKTCMLAIPIHVPSFLRVVIDRIHVRGHSSLGETGHSVLSAEVFTPGVQGTRLEHSAQGPLEEYLDLDSSESTSELLVSECGVDTNLRMNLAARVRSQLDDSESHTQVEAIELGFHLESCLE